MDFLKITIDFDQSHQFFPRIVGWLLVMLGAAIVAVYRREMIAALRAGAVLLPRELDRPKFFGCIVLVALYLLVMDPLSDLWPNRGYAFLIASMAFMFALSRLFVREPDRTKTLVMAASSVAVPALTWWIFADIFQLTLP